MLHADGKPDGFVKTAAERLVYALWDLRLEVGYSVRDLATCDRLASEDHTARTALLDLRHLAGDRDLFRTLERAELHGLSAAKVEKFLADKLDEMRGRRERFGDSLYLLEPNIKESEGGLRDLHSALWLARVRFKVAGITELLSRALLPEREIREMRRARDFLWRVRNEMHYLAGRKWDQLTFDVQPQLAAAMGYADGEGKVAVEEFMRHYYLAAKTVIVACDAIVDRCLEPQNASGWRMVPPPAAVIGAERPVTILRGQPTRAADRFLPGGELKVFRGRLSVLDKEVLRRTPAALVRLFATTDREGLDLYPYARDLAAQVATELPPEAASDPELNQELLAAFARPGTRGRFLTLMHEIGVLPHVLPEFARVTARRQIDLYHVYTVDVHTLFAVRRLFSLRCGDVKEPVLGELMQAQKRPLALYLGTLFHDIGKGSGRDHSIRGAEIAVEACTRMRVDPADAADIEWLVLKHLRMSAIAQRRDLSDPRPDPRLRRGGRHARPAGEALPAHLRRHRHRRPAHLDRVEGAAAARAVREDARRPGPRASAGPSPGRPRPPAASGWRRRWRRALRRRGSGCRERLPGGHAGPLLRHRRRRRRAARPAAPRSSGAAGPLAARVRHRPRAGALRGGHHRPATGPGSWPPWPASSRPTASTSTTPRSSRRPEDPALGPLVGAGARPVPAPRTGAVDAAGRPLAGRPARPGARCSPARSRSTRS